MKELVRLIRDASSNTLGKKASRLRGLWPLAVMTALSLGCEQQVSPTPEPRPVKKPVAAAQTGSATASSSAAPAPVKQAQRVTRFDKKSPYTRVLVVDEGDARILRFGEPDKGDQSQISLAEPKQVALDYVRMAALGLLLIPKREKMLMIGLGGGSFSTLIRTFFPAVSLEVVEIDPVVVEAAEQFFSVKQDDKLKIHVKDGAEFVRTAAGSYDLILLDAYDATTIPEQLTTDDFFNAVKRRLGDQGVVVLNLAVTLDKEIEIERRFRAIFPDVRCGRCQQTNNLLLFGRATEGLSGMQQVVTAARQLTVDAKLPFELADSARRLQYDCNDTR